MRRIYQSLITRYYHSYCTHHTEGTKIPLFNDVPCAFNGVMIAIPVSLGGLVAAAAGLFRYRAWMKDRTDEVDSAIVAFRCPKELVGAIEHQAAVEGITKSDVARRACIRDVMPRRIGIES